MKKIIHIDMDCFYAAVEMRDDPRLKNRPVAVGGRPDRRGVIATCNYIAREFGVHSALSSAIAKQRCPDLVVLPPNLKKYRDVSRQIQRIFRFYTDKIEPLSLDEAYLDVTDSEHMQGSATFIAQAIKKQIHDRLQLTASAGVAPNKFLAKVASDWNKPDGLKVITPDEVDDFVFHLPIEKIHGVGKVTAKKLHLLNLRTCGDLRDFGEEALIQRFGRFGKQLFAYSQGDDQREVSSSGERKSVSVENTFSNDCHSVEECLDKLPQLISSLSKRLGKVDNRVMHKLFVKMKFNDFSRTTVETLCDHLDVEVLKKLTREAYQRRELPVRLMGIGARYLPPRSSEYTQLDLPFH